MHTESSSDCDSKNAETTKTVKLGSVNSSFSSQCREKVRSAFVRLRPEDDENCKLKFLVNDKFFAGVKPTRSPLIRHSRRKSLPPPSKSNESRRVLTKRF